MAKSGLSDTDVESLFGEVCGLDNGAPCVGITPNATTGVYGAFGMCNATQQLSYAFNAYYLQQMSSNSGNTDACDFKGSASTQSPASPSGTCSSLLSQAGAAGTGTVTSVPSGTSSSSGSSSSSTSTKKSAAGTVTVPNFSLGMVQLGLYVTVAALVGAGMLLL